MSEKRVAKIEEPIILLVEDNPANILVAKTLLSEFGFKFQIAENGNQAVKLYRHGSYALILMDVQMPIMSGIEATMQIRDYEGSHFLSSIPIIGLTANDTLGQRRQCIDSGMNDFLAKPYSSQQLKQKINANLGNYSAT